MKTRLYIIVATLLSGIAWAQSSLDEDINGELDRMYEQTKSGNASVQVNVQPQLNANQSAVQSSDLGVRIQKQPTTVIEASPLVESRAEQMRKARQDSELQTEQKIVEKLEQSRMEDEQKRAQALFGDRFDNMKGSAPAESASSDASIDKEMIRNEVSAALSDIKKEEPENETYFAGLVGAGDYPDARNVRGNYSVGFAVGQRLKNRILVEGAFIFSNYEIEQSFPPPQYNCSYWGCSLYPRITSMDQYNLALDIKYQALGGGFRPVFGGVVSYTHRTFSDTQLAITSAEYSSQSFDMGLLAGADLEVSDGFSIGLDIRYMWNLTNRSSNDGFQRYTQYNYGQGTPIEKLNYMTIGIVGRGTF